jgi:hypothetical protein
LKLLRSKFIGVLCMMYFVLPVFGWLIPSFRSTFATLNEFISVFIVGSVLVWFVGQVRNYPPPLNSDTAKQSRQDCLWERRANRL